MRIYNTLSRKKEEFVPLEPGKVRIYACGPTVYTTSISAMPVPSAYLMCCAVIWNTAAMR